MLSAKQTHKTQFSVADHSNLVKQLVDVEILYLLTFSSKSGYELKKQLLNWFKINVSYGTLYPHLHSLEKTGYVSGKWLQKFDSAPLKKRIYSLTDAGNEILRSSIESLTKIALTMQFMITRVNMQTANSNNENVSAFALVENFFAGRNYKVKRSIAMRGFSGSEYIVDVLAVSPGAQSSNVMLRMLDKKDVTIDDILKTHVMSFDLGASRSIILSASESTDEISKLAEFYHISIFNGSDLEKAAQNMCASYKL